MIGLIFGPRLLDHQMVIQPIDASSEGAKFATYAFSIQGDPSVGLLRPLAVSVAPNRDVYIADSGHAAIQVVDADGRFIRKFGPRIDGLGELEVLTYPVSVVADDLGIVYVSDLGQRRVYKLNDQGRFIGYFGEANGNREFGVPAGLFVKGDRVYLNDLERHQVLVFDREGKPVSTIGGGQGAGPGQLNYANYSWVDDQGQIYVGDSNNNRVQVFNVDGQLERILPNPQEKQGLSIPRGVAVDSQGSLHVAGALDHQVSVFSKRGRKLFSYGQGSVPESKLLFPNGVWIAGNRVYVADRENNRVQVWELS